MYRILQEKYIDFTTNISNDAMSISYEGSLYLWNHLLKYKPKTILERGMGFSTYILSLYKKMAEYDVDFVTVETKESWKYTIDDFLIKNKLAVDDVIMWEDYTKFNLNRKFDFIFEDAHKPFRSKTAQFLANHIEKNGTIIYDDANSNSYINGIAKVNGFEYSPLHETRDNFKRFMGLAKCV